MLEKVYFCGVEIFMAETQNFTSLQPNIKQKNGKEKSY